jgi:hypothetical protein
MSVDRNVYIGPYAECVYKQEKTTEERTGCVNAKCKAHREESADAFCSKCGKATSTFTVEVDEEPADVADLTDETLSAADSGAYQDSIDRTYVIPNMRRKGAPKLEDVEDLDGAIDLRTRDMAAECAWYEQAFAKELGALRPAFASVEVKWGLLQWFS